MSNILIAIVEKIDSFFAWTSRICCVICGVLLIGVTLIIFAGVINRAFLDFTWLFVEEYSSLALIPISYLAMGYTLRWNQHLKMDIVVRNVPDLVRKIFGVFAAIFSLICIVYMLTASIDWFVYTFTRHVTSSGTLRTPLWTISLTMAAGIILFAVDMLLLIVHRLYALFTGGSLLKFTDDDYDSMNEEESLI